MEGVRNTTAALCSAITSTSRRVAKWTVRIIVGAAIVFVAYLLLPSPRITLPPSKAPTQSRLKSSALRALEAPVLPGLKSALSLPKVHAQTICSDSSLSGYWSGYSYNSSGQNVNNYQFDGQGNITFGDYVSTNGSGNNGGGSFTGTYTLSGNCIGTMSITTGGSFDIVLTLNGAELDVIPTNSGSQFMEILKPTWNNQCSSDAALSGYYGGYSQNTTSESVDEYYFNGAGSLNGNWYGSGGSGSFSGTYTLQSQCIGGTSYMNLSTGGAFWLVLVQNGTAGPEVDMIAANKGSSFWEILKPMQ